MATVRRVRIGNPGGKGAAGMGAATSCLCLPAREFAAHCALEVFGPVRIDGETPPFCFLGPTETKPHALKKACHKAHVMTPSAGSPH